MMQSMVESKSVEESELRARQLAGAGAALLSWVAWITCMIVAQAVRVLGTVDDGYRRPYQTEGSQSAERWLMCVSGVWFVLGVFFLWTGMTSRQLAYRVAMGLVIAAFFAGIGVLCVFYGGSPQH